MPAIRWSN